MQAGKYTLDWNSGREEREEVKKGTFSASGPTGGSERGGLFCTCRLPRPPQKKKAPLDLEEEAPMHSSNNCVEGRRIGGRGGGGGGARI